MEKTRLFIAFLFLLSLQFLCEGLDSKVNQVVWKGSLSRIKGRNPLMAQHPSLLIIEDEQPLRRVLDMVLRPEGYEIHMAKSGEEGLQTFQDFPCLDLVLTDLQLGSMTGLEVLTAVKQRRPEIPVIILTGYGTVPSAVAAMRNGAYDYISRPVDNEELKIVVARALEVRQLTKENKNLRERLTKRFGFEEIIAVSQNMKDVINLARVVAGTEVTVLLTGESGTGKELVANAIHQESSRANRPFLAMNCAGIPDHLLESELFGYEKGAFTDAKKSKPGRFQLAEGGTLFLDEIGAMSVVAQAKLLRVMEERIVYPLGGMRGVKLDIRFIVATNENLVELIKKGLFREDLYYRLHVYPIHLPPLRHRHGDMAPLLQSFLDQANRERGTRPRHFSSEAMTILYRYSWPGNVRELQHVVEWILITCQEEIIEARHLPIDLRLDHQAPFTRPSLLSFGLALDEMESTLIQEALEKTNGNISEACRLLGISRNTLRYRIGKYGLTSRKPIGP